MTHYIHYNPIIKSNVRLEVFWESLGFSFVLQNQAWNLLHSHAHGMILGAVVCRAWSWILVIPLTSGLPMIMWFYNYHLEIRQFVIFFCIMNAIPYYCKHFIWKRQYLALNRVHIPLKWCMHSCWKSM